MDWQNFLELSDSSLEDLKTVGYLYIKQGCFKIALEIFNAISIIDPTSVYALQTLGALYLQLEEYSKALDFLDKALKLDPKNDLIMLNKSKALFSLGYITQGLSLAKIISKSNDKKFSRQAIALIESYS